MIRSDETVNMEIGIAVTAISFATFTKWWHALPVDAPDTMMGLIFFAIASDGWHTSTSFQLFYT